MSTSFGSAVAGLFLEFADVEGAAISETLEVCRVTRTRCGNAETFARLAAAASLSEQGGFGDLRVFGDISGPLGLAATSYEDIAAEALQIVLTKARTTEWCYFLTQNGFEAALGDDLVSVPMAIWVAVPFDAFSSLTITVSPWNGAQTPPHVQVEPERPRKLVRDLTNQRTPAVIGPWLLKSAPASGSSIYSIWQAAAIERLSFALPYEIRTVEADDTVFLKGLRSTPVAIVPSAVFGWTETIFGALTEAATWVYASPREAEARFLFLNNHLSLDWHDGLYWPDGLQRVLAGSLTSAREAYAFHLQDQSKDALKTLGDLRKSLQDEVARAQTATKDLLSALWRDLAVAGIVLALRAPTAAQIARAEVLRWVTLATALLLVVSLAVTVLSSWRFNSLADQGRVEWYPKLYAFVSKDEWARLVERPIAKGRCVYWIALPIVAFLYLAAAAYLTSLAEPGRFAAAAADLAGLVSK